MAALPAVFDPSTIPPAPLPAIAELRSRRQWVAWRNEFVDGRPKPTKVPINPHNGRKAAVSRSWEWADYNRAKLRAESDGLDGTGYVLAPDDDTTGGDLDNCVDEDGAIAPWAQEIVDLAETYMEFSPSGRGIRIFMRGKIGAAFKSNEVGVEVYDRARYLTVTERHIEGTPGDINPAPKTLELLRARVAAAKDARRPDPSPEVASRRHEVAVGTPGGGERFWKAVNDLALLNLGAWVPVLFPRARFQPGTGAYRVSSRDLGRDLEEDLSIAPNGIVDFGIADMGDAREGKRSPTFLVAEVSGIDTTDAALWLCRQIGRDPEALGWEKSSSGSLDHETIARNVLATAAARIAKADAGEEPFAVPASAWHGRPIAPRGWHVPELIPARTVTLLGGDGATGKSLVALQLAASTALRRPWMGFEVAGGRALFMTAEDDDEETQHRLEDIAYAEGVELSALDDLMISIFAGKDAVLGAASGKGGQVTPTAVFDRLARAIKEIEPAIVILDTLADLFAGEENSRTQARQFVQLLRGLAIRHETTIVLLSHPSLSGLSSGSGMSGSTAWNNSVRSRLYLARVHIQDGDKLVEPDADVRVLTSKKANYAQSGIEIHMRWQNGIFVADERDKNMFATANRMVMAERKFLDLLAAYSREGRPVRATTGHGYAPAAFADDPRSNGITRNTFTMAMNRLFEKERLQVIEEGAPSRRYKRIIEVASEE